ncbi:MAG: hypothetical protein LBQ39_10675 [Tannerellaceae bacterium]|jgi:hypothetical protein|nr:hypothetical protein [Tannerellaceae bacterium]
MNREDNYIDQLTRDLLQSAGEEPSAGLGLRIMQRIEKEAPLARRKVVVYADDEWKATPLIIAGVALYLMLAGCVIGCLFQPEIVDEAIREMKENFPYIVTACVIFGPLTFFAKLDRLIA